jgi:hypothetical protein
VRVMLLLLLLLLLLLRVVHNLHLLKGSSS